MTPRVHCPCCVTDDMILLKDHLQSLVMLLKVFLVRNASKSISGRCCKLENDVTGHENLCTRRRKNENCIPIETPQAETCM